VSEFSAECQGKQSRRRQWATLCAFSSIQLMQSVFEPDLLAHILGVVPSTICELPSNCSSSFSRLGCCSTRSSDIPRSLSCWMILCFSQASSPPPCHDFRLLSAIADSSQMSLFICQHEQKSSRRTRPCITNLGFSHSETTD
jgi:hypothetical protein